MDGIVQKYHPDWLEEIPHIDDKGSGGQSQLHSPKHESKLNVSAKTVEKKSKTGEIKPVPPSRLQIPIDKMPVRKSLECYQ